MTAMKPGNTCHKVWCNEPPALPSFYCAEHLAAYRAEQDQCECCGEDVCDCRIVTAADDDPHVGYYADRDWCAVHERTVD